MALPEDDLATMQQLAQRHDSERSELEGLNAYYEGTQPLTYMHPEIFREVQPRIQPVIIAWPQLVVDAIEERLDVEGFRLPDEDSDDADLWRVWQENDLDEETQLAHVDALVMRRAYTAVGTNEDDADTPIVTVESPLEMYADLDPRTRKVRAALKRTFEPDSIVRTGDRSATLYLPNRTVRFDWQGGWKEVDRDEHELGEVPVTPIVNRGRLRLTNRNGVGGMRYGQSELASILPLSNAANKIATDMMVAAEFVSLPLRGLWGIGPDDLVDSEGNKLTALQVIMGRLLTLPNPDDGNAEGREFQFAPASLANFHDSINQLAKLVASIAGLPPDYLGLSTDNPPSAESRKAGEIRLIKRAERKQRAFGGSYERTGRLVRRFQTGEWDPKLRRLETIWRDASTPTVAQKADATVKLYSATPRPIVTLRQARQDIGYTDAQIRLMEAEDAEADQRDPVAEIARQLQPQMTTGAVDDESTPAGNGAVTGGRA